MALSDYPTYKLYPTNPFQVTQKQIDSATEAIKDFLTHQKDYAEHLKAQQAVDNKPVGLAAWLPEPGTGLFENVEARKCESVRLQGIDFVVHLDNPPTSTPPPATPADRELARFELIE